MLHSANCFYIAINVTVLKNTFSFVFIDRRFAFFQLFPRSEADVLL